MIGVTLQKPRVIRMRRGSKVYDEPKVRGADIVECVKWTGGNFEQAAA
jgi:hypothetical protein